MTTDIRPFIIVSGLPASGKTTLARGVAQRLGLPFLDKDDILEALFEGLGTGDMAWRQRLSRSSDLVLRTMAEASCGALLTSFWRHPTSTILSGTPTDWIAALSTRIVEVHCECPVSVAVDRFQARIRHPGHNDGKRSRDILLSQFSDLAAQGPLRIDQLVTVNTSAPVDLDSVVAMIARSLAPALPLVEFLESIHIAGLDLTRDVDAGRPTEL